MKKTVKRYASAAIFGIAYAMIAIALSQYLIRNLGRIVIFVRELAGLEDDIAEMVSNAFAQLKDASLVFPVHIAASIALLSGSAFFFAAGKKRMRVVFRILAVILLAPISVLFVCFTEVNGVETILLLKSLLPMLKVL